MPRFLEEYDLALLVLGLAAFGVVGLPRVLGRRPLSFPIIYVIAGVVLFSLPTGLTRPDPREYGDIAERLTEIGVVVSLMGAGLAIDRPIGWRRWATTWRLLGITMPLTILFVALLGRQALGLTVPAALLLGAVLAPTDPVLASDVQVGEPNEGEDEDEVRVALTSEAGLNDGLAFPFTNLAILMAMHGTALGAWGWEFISVEVFYKIAVGAAGGLLVGLALGVAIFHRRSPLPSTMDGMIALAATLISYSATELVGGYGFLAVFVAALAIRSRERHTEYVGAMHTFSGQMERLLSAVLLILFGGAIVSGLLAPGGWKGALVALVIVLLVRPLAGALGLIGSRPDVRRRAAISFFGIRGIGSFYYVAHALNIVEFQQREVLWAVTGMVVVISVVVHGVTATPVMRAIDRRTTGAG